MINCQVGHRPDEDRGILDYGLTGHIQGSNYLRASTAVVDCGVKDLKGIARPEHVYQVLKNASFSLLATIFFNFCRNKRMSSKFLLTTPKIGATRTVARSILWFDLFSCCASYRAESTSVASTCLAHCC